MASQTAKGSGSTVNNGGTVAHGGAITGVTQSLDLNDINGAIDVTARYGSKVVAKTGSGGTDGDPTNVTNPDGIQTSKGSGSLAYNRARGDDMNWIIRGAGETNAGKINTTATTKLHIPAAHVDDNHGRHPLPIISTKKHGVRQIEVTARPSTARHSEAGGSNWSGSPGGANVFTDSADDGINPATLALVSDTRAIPGELTYMFGGKEPARSDYKSKESYES